MRTIVLSMVAAVALVSVASLAAAAMPAIGAAAIAQIGRQVDPVITVKTKKKATAPCPTDQVRSNRTGFCRPSNSQY
jgi:hypothetical protein